MRIVLPKPLGKRQIWGAERKGLFTRGDGFMSWGPSMSWLPDPDIKEPYEVLTGTWEREREVGGYRYLEVMVRYRFEFTSSTEARLRERAIVFVHLEGRDNKAYGGFFAVPVGSPPDGWKGGTAGEFVEGQAKRILRRLTASSLGSWYPLMERELYRKGDDFREASFFEIESRGEFLRKRLGDDFLSSLEKEPLCDWIDAPPEELVVRSFLF